MNAMSGLITVLGCRKCGKCDSACNAGALVRTESIARIDYDKCTLCLQCIAVCPNKALTLLE